MRAFTSNIAQLKQAIENPRQVLLFHLRNHYALVFGYRERVTDGADWLATPRSLPAGVLRREILSARKGQQPRDWIDLCHSGTPDITNKNAPRWSIRDTLLKWKGYKMLLLQLRDGKFVDTRVGTLKPLVDAAARWDADHGYSRCAPAAVADDQESGASDADGAKDADADDEDM